MRQNNLLTTLLFLMLALCIQPLTSQTREYWTLEDCIEFAWQNNLQLQQQKLSVSIARENLIQSKANVYPNLNAGASHAYNVGRTVDPFTNDFITETVQSNNFNVTSGVNLFNGFQLRNIIRQNEHELEAGKLDLERSYNDVALTVASAYLQILFSLEVLENANNQLDISLQQVERTEKLVEAGTLPRGSLLTIQAQMATEELQVVNANNQLDIAILNLRQMLYLPVDDEFTIEVPQVDILPDEEVKDSPMQVYQTALQIQPEIKSAEVRVFSAEKGLAASKGARSPSLALRGSLGTGYSDARRETVGEPQIVIDPITGLPSVEFQTRVKPFNDQIRENRNYSIGIFLNIPIFNNYQVRSNISRSQINLENARIQNQIVRDQLFKTIQQAHADAQAALKRYMATEKNVVALEEAYRYTEQRFNVGMVNSLEYNDSKNRLNIANSELLQSKYEYVFRTKILEFYMGIPLRM
jgi:outer membrane protein